MFRFAHPDFLYLLFLLPALVAFYVYAMIVKKKAIKKYGNPTLLAELMPEVSTKRQHLKFWLLFGAITMVIFIIAGPQFGSKLETVKRQGVEIMVCLDVSNSMLAEDVSPNRLDKAKQMLSRLTDGFTNDKVGLIVFAGDAYVQLPITTDYVSANMFINSVSTNMVPTQGTAIGSAIDMALESFTPDTKTGRAIIVITDGENFEDDAVESAARAADAGVIVDIIGLGTASGAPILIDRNKGVYMTDSQGQQVITALNAAEAQKIAKAGKGIYVSGNSSNAIGDINSQLDTLAKTDFMRTTFSPASEQFPAFAVLALILLIIDALTPTRKITWLTKFNFFTSNKPRTK